MLEANGLKKSYDGVRAVDGVSFRVKEGEILGLLGPNGAGKTTTVSMAAGLLTPDGGEVLVDGTRITGDTDPRKGLLGLVPQEIALFDKLSAEDNLRFFGALYNIYGTELDIAVERALDYAGLRDRAKSRVKTFSGGMKRRFNLAVGFLHGPKVLLLDEPTVGVDPQSRNAIFDSLEALRDDGMAILYTTHYMEEAERLCNRVIIIDHGRVVAEDTPAALCNGLSATNRIRVEPSKKVDLSIIDRLRKLPGVVSAVMEQETILVELEDLTTGAPAVLSWLSGRGVGYTHVSSERANLETVFLELTGRSLRD